MCARRYGECSLLECARLTDRAPCVRSALPGRKRGEKRSEAKEGRYGSGSIFRIHIMGQRRSQSLQYLSNICLTYVILTSSKDGKYDVRSYLSLMTRSLELRFVAWPGSGWLASPCGDRPAAQGAHGTLSPAERRERVAHLPLSYITSKTPCCPRLSMLGSLYLLCSSLR